jgi:hypothetical protein
MATVTDSDLQEIKDLITVGFTRLDEKITGLDNRLIRLETKMETKLDTLEPSIQKIPDLAEKVGELKNWKQIGLTLGGAIIGGIISYLARSANP